MYCAQCGKENIDNTNYCSHCGFNIKTSTKTTEASHKSKNTDDSMTFSKSISTCFGKFFDFKGKASRPEFWWFYLFTTLLTWGLMLVDKSDITSTIFSLIVLFPIIAAGSRRLHDTNRSGWWQLIMITVVGFIPLIIWYASKGAEEANQHSKPV